MKKFYQRLAPRERLLLLGFVALLGGLWFWGALVRSGRVLERWRDCRTEMAAQELWLARRDAIESDARQAARSLQPEQTLDATKLFSEVNRLARGLTYEVSGQRTEQTDRLAIHQVQLTLRKVDMAALLEFNTAVQQRAPYLGVERCEVSVDRTEPGRMNASFRLYAIQVRSAVKT